MFEPKSRLRYRSTPLPSKYRGVYKLGDWFIEDGPHSDRWVLVNSKTGLLDNSFVTWERTKDELHGKPPYNSGGPFESIKIDRSSCMQALVIPGTYTSDADYFSVAGHNGRVRYVGGFMPPTLADLGVASLDVGNELLVDSLIPDVRTLGSTVWDRLKPKIEQGGLFVAIAEAKDVPHMLHSTAEFFHETWLTLGGFTKSKLMTPKFAGDQFLNYNFGWVPFVKDVNDLLSNIINFTTKIQRLAKENGQWIRRRATLVNHVDGDKTISSDVGNKLYPGVLFSWWFFYDPAHGSDYRDPYWQIIDRKTTYSTAVGQFRYWLPEFAGPSNNPYLEKINSVKRALDLFGARISPSNIYKAIPWTWLIDWVTGVGRSLQALQDETLDHMAAKYMSMSHHVESTRVFRQVLPFTPSNGGLRTVEFTQITDVKQRIMATSPFGLYLDASTLTSHQLAILGALGLAKKSYGRH